MKKRRGNKGNATASVFALITISVFIFIGAYLFFVMSPTLASEFEIDVTNETLNVTSTNPMQLNHTDLKVGSVTAYNDTAQSVQIPASNMTIDYDDGTIAFTSEWVSSSRSPSELVSVNYIYHGGEGWTSADNTISNTTMAFNLVSILPLVLAAGAVLGAVLLLARR